MRPCPACGLYQPDMVASQRFQFHLAVGAAAAGAVTLVGAVGAAGGRQWATTLIGAAISVLALLVQGALLLWNPNRNPDANRVKAKRLERSGLLEPMRGDIPELANKGVPHRRLGYLHAIALGGLALAVLPFLAAEAVRVAAGWPLNRDWHPAVLGPGDESRVFFPESVQSVQGLWSGRADAELLNARELGLDQGELEATTHQATWPGVIRFDQNRSRTYSVGPWADVRIPDSPQLNGKEVRVKVDVVATYPADRGTHFVNEQHAFTQTVVIHLADRPGAGRLYVMLANGGTFGGALWLLLMGLLLALAGRSFRRDAYPAKVFAEREDDEVDDDYRPRRVRRRRIRDDD
jgi:hypothetical protein